MMETIDTHGTFDEAIAGASDAVQELARQLRALIAGVYPEVVEVPWPKQQIIGYGIGPKKMSEHFGYIAVQREYANLGFNYGADLPDPAGWLEGAGKKFRHVKISDAAQMEEPALRAMLAAAVAERKRTLGRD
jgi:hypothetical protein